VLLLTSAYLRDSMGGAVHPKARGRNMIPGPERRITSDILLFVRESHAAASSRPRSCVAFSGAYQIELADLYSGFWIVRGFRTSNDKVSAACWSVISRYGFSILAISEKEQFRRACSVGYRNVRYRTYVGRLTITRQLIPDTVGRGPDLLPGGCAILLTFLRLKA